MSNSDKRNFVEERLRKQAEKEAKEELYESIRKIESDPFLKDIVEKRGQILYHEKEERYKFHCTFYGSGEVEELKEKIKISLDKRVDEIYEKLADELVDKLNNLEFLFQGGM